jgi:hypothetical protein
MTERKLKDGDLILGYNAFHTHTRTQAQRTYIVCHKGLQLDAVWVMVKFGIPLDNLYLRDDCHEATLWFMAHPPAHNFPYNLSRMLYSVYRDGPPKQLKG